MTDEELLQALKESKLETTFQDGLKIMFKGNVETLNQETIKNARRLFFAGFSICTGVWKYDPNKLPEILADIELFQLGIQEDLI